MRTSALAGSLTERLLVLGLLAASFAPLPARAASTAVVLDGPAVLRQSPGEIETSLGAPVRSRTVSPGDFLLPDGGTWRIYQRPGAQIDVDFEGEHATTVTIGFPDASI